MEEKIELRSEKIQHIIGKMPTSLERTSKIVLVILYILLGIAIYIWYTEWHAL